MGINLGAFLAPLITGYLGEEINWHLGFAVAALGMTFAVIQYVLGGRWLGNAGTAVGDAVGGQVARLAGDWPLPTYFLTFGLASVALGLGAFMFTKHIRTLMAGIH